jgi:hypothetical protein
MDLDQEEKQRIELERSVEYVTGTEVGRRLLWDIISYCGVYKDLGGENSQVFKDLGKREVGLHILDLLDIVDDEIIIKMMKESKQRTKNLEIENERRTKLERDNNDGNDDNEYRLPRHDSHAGGIF